ncbi:MAG: AraC family transcriptional regulator [Parasporobacterium sp.]|nr:AraC family transcriptional regulator [Parasporobacterium sp.]
MSYLSRIFKSNTGKGILEYINEVRIHAACRYLDQGYSLKEAAEMVGYCTQRSFQRAFEKVMGIKPGDYKRS